MANKSDEETILKEFISSIQDLEDTCKTIQKKKEMTDSKKIRELLQNKINNVGRKMNQLFFETDLNNLNEEVILEGLDKLLNITNLFSLLSLKDEDYFLIRSLTLSLHNYILNNLLESNIKSSGVFQVVIGKALIQLLSVLDENNNPITNNKNNFDIIKSPIEQLDLEIKLLYSLSSLFLTALNYLPSHSKEEIIEWTTKLFPNQYYHLEILENYPYEEILTQEKINDDSEFLSQFFATIVTGSIVVLYYSKILAIFPPKEWANILKSLNKHHHELIQRLLGKCIDIEEKECLVSLTSLFYEKYIYAIGNAIDAINKGLENNKLRLKSAVSLPDFKIISFMQSHFEVQQQYIEEVFEIYKHINQEESLSMEFVKVKVNPLYNELKLLLKKLEQIFGNKEKISKTPFFAIYLSIYQQILTIDFLIWKNMRLNNISPSNETKKLLQEVNDIIKTTHLNISPRTVAIHYLYRYIMAMDEENISLLNSLRLEIREITKSEVYNKYYYFLKYLDALIEIIVNEEKAHQKISKIFQSLKHSLEEFTYNEKIIQFFSEIISFHLEKLERKNIVLLFEKIQFNPYDAFSFINKNNIHKFEKLLNRKILPVPFITDSLWLTD